jgi:hypothetical protein
MASDSAVTFIMQGASLLLIACCIFLISSLLASLTFVIHRNYTNNINKKLTGKWLFLHAISAVCASVVVTIWLSMPNLSRLPLVFNHCHSNNCATHVPAAIDSSLLNLLFAFFAISMLMICFILLKAHKNKLKERINLLLRLSQSQTTAFNDSSQVTLVNTLEPLLLNVGLLTPRLLVSSQITEVLHLSDVKVLLAYEYGKAKQFENVKIKLVQICCLFWPSTIRRLLVTDVRNNVYESAYKDVYQLLGRQQTNISKAMLDNMAKDIRDFIVKINSPNQAILTDTNALNDTRFTTSAYFMICVYFICLIAVTSNVTHFLFELME